MDRRSASCLHLGHRKPHWGVHSHGVPSKRAEPLAGDVSATQSGSRGGSQGREGRGRKPVEHRWTVGEGGGVWAWSVLGSSWSGDKRGCLAPRTGAGLKSPEEQSGLVRLGFQKVLSGSNTSGVWKGRHPGALARVATAAWMGVAGAWAPSGMGRRKQLSRGSTATGFQCVAQLLGRSESRRLARRLRRVACGQRGRWITAPGS